MFAHELDGGRKSLREGGTGVIISAAAAVLCRQTFIANNGTQDLTLDRCHADRESERACDS